MKNKYTTHLLIVLLIFTYATGFSQTRNRNYQFHIYKNPSGIVQAAESADVNCDTINFPIPGTWTIGLSEVEGGGGYHSGSNKYEDKQVANYFDLSSTSFTHLNGVRLFAGIAGGPDLSRKIILHIYGVLPDDSPDGIDIGPGTEIPLSVFKSDVAGGVYTDIEFVTEIALPSSKKFFVSADMSDLRWKVNVQDSFALYQNKNEETNPGTAWSQFLTGQWANFNSPFSWNENVSLLILPMVSTGVGVCSTLPVHFSAFTAQRVGKDVKLSWNISDEINVKDYELQRADNNNNFKTVALVQAVNGQKDQSYVITDKNAFSFAPTIQYRIKQTDKNGIAQFSRTISVKAASAVSDLVFANPFNGTFHLQLNLSEATQVSFSIFDMQGRLIASKPAAMYSAAINQISLSQTSALKSGTYILKVTAGNETITQKIVKQ